MTRAVYQFTEIPTDFTPLVEVDEVAYEKCEPEFNKRWRLEYVGIDAAKTGAINGTD